jgi:hypothetical protein
MKNQVKKVRTTMTKSIGADKLFTLEQIKYRALHIKIDNEEGVNDSHSQSHYDGICLGLDMLIDELEGSNFNDE